MKQRKRYPLDNFYARYDFYQKHRLQRWKNRVLNRVPKLLCQDCGGVGLYHEAIEGLWEPGPSYTCGWCRGIGYVDAWTRGVWLRIRKAEAAEAAREASEGR